jgi:hypothetical protein
MVYLPLLLVLLQVALIVIVTIAVVMKVALVVINNLAVVEIAIIKKNKAIVMKIG